MIGAGLSNFSGKGLNMPETMYSADTLIMARHNMVEHQIRCCKILDPDLLDMLGSMPREDFVPENVRSLAYMEGHVPLPCKQEMLSPLQEAAIMQQLALEGHEKVLEIGTGTAYLTNLLALRTHSVTSCEIHEELASIAKTNLENHGIDNANVVHINAMDEDAMKNNSDIADSYDVIVIGGALKEIPIHIRSRLSDSSQLIAFIGKNPVLHLTHELHKRGACTTTVLFETLLQDLEGIPEKRELVF